MYPSKAQITNITEGNSITLLMTDRHIKKIVCTPISWVFFEILGRHKHKFKKKNNHQKNLDTLLLLSVSLKWVIMRLKSIFCLSIWYEMTLLFYTFSHKFQYISQTVCVTERSKSANGFWHCKKKNFS